jgi:hypothetical protein
MLWLTGLFGAMVLGGVACMELAPVEEDDPEVNFEDFLDEHGLGRPDCMSAPQDPFADTSGAAPDLLETVEAAGASQSAADTVT